MDPRRWHTREDSGLRLDGEGRWWHDGELIDHPRIVEAFNQGLRCTDEGRFKLELGSDWCFVEVEDAAYRVLAVEPVPGGYLLELSDRTRERLDPTTLAVDATGALRCAVKGGRAPARFSRDAHFALGSRLHERDGGLWLEVGEGAHPVRPSS